jgi:hypothetical protein
MIGPACFASTVGTGCDQTTSCRVRAVRASKVRSPDSPRFPITRVGVPRLRSVVFNEHVAHVRHVTGDMWELIRTVAWFVCDARAFM